jgi:hypothetical protein
LLRTNPVHRSNRRAVPAVGRALAVVALVAGAIGCSTALVRAADDAGGPPTSLTATGGPGTTGTEPAPGSTTSSTEAATTTTGAPPETAPPATPETTEAPEPPTTVQHLPPTTAAAVAFADQVRALLPGGIDGRLPGWTVSWEGSRTGYLAATYPASRSIVVYVRPGRSVALTAYDLAHEYGHALDVTYLNDGTRRQWMQRRGFDAAWFGCDMCNDFSTPSGDWAESVAVCLTGNRGTFRSRLGGLPGAADCGWIAATVGPW